MANRRTEHHCLISREDIEAFRERNRGRTLDLSELAPIDRINVWYNKFRDKPNAEVGFEAINAVGRIIVPHACQALHELVEWHIN